MPRSWPDDVIYFPQCQLISLKLKQLRTHITREKITGCPLLRDHDSNNAGPAPEQWGERLSLPLPEAGPSLRPGRSGPKGKKVFNTGSGYGLRFQEGALTFSETCPVL